MEQPDVPAGTAPSLPVMSPRPALSNEVRASLDAIRVAREAARERARRQTVHARLWFAITLAAAAVAAAAAGPRIVRWRHARAQAATRAHQPVKSPQPTAALPRPAAAQAQPALPSIAPPAVGTVPAAATAPSPATVADVSAAAPPTKARDVASDEACDTASIRHAPWRLSPDACARAFDADPTNAALALAVAHGALVRGRFEDAGHWAVRALALDPKMAEAYVIIARAESESGRDDGARTAYQHYLELAPRGWHKAEAHAALQARPLVPIGSAGDR